MRNDRGDRLIDFCGINNLVICNTLFQQPPRRMFTWTSPDGRTKNQIDFIMIRNRWKNAILTSKTLPGADCGTDHELLMAQLKVKFKKVRKTTHPVRYDLVNIPPRFTIETSNKFEELSFENNTSDEVWEEMKAVIHNTMEATVPKRKFHKKSPWISQDSINLAEKRRLLKNKPKTTANRVKYKELSRLLQRQIRKDKEKYYNSLCNDLEESNTKGKTRNFFQKIREITGKCKPRSGAIKSESGTVLNDIAATLERWKTYTENLYKKDEQLSRQPVTLEGKQEPSIMQSEVEVALREVANNKSPGWDNIPIEIWKCLGDKGIKTLTKICQKIWDTGKWPQDWKKSIYLTLPKKGDLGLCENYRTIALISHTSKVLLKVIHRRLEAFLNSQLSDEQAGFRKCRGTRDHIANLRWLMESAIERQKNVYLGFIDYTKAFDGVDHDILWNNLKRMGAPQHTIQLLRDLYKDQLAIVRTEHGDTEWFGIGRGVRQGCILSPTLYNLYSEQIVRETFEDTSWGFRIGGSLIQTLRYADDTTLVAESEQDLIDMLNRLRTNSQAAGLNMNVKKTKVMATEQMRAIFMNGQDIEVVREFNFLGSLITDTGGSESEIKKRLTLGKAAMNALSRIWKDRGLSVQTKLRIVNALVFPVATYAAETWTTTKSTRKNIQAFELWCYRRMLRIPWTKRVSNARVLTRVDEPSPLDGRILRRKIVYYGHVSRADGMEKMMMLGMVEGRRRRGRPKSRWIGEITEALGMSTGELERAAEDRERWRRLSWRAAQSRIRL